MDTRPPNLNEFVDAAKEYTQSKLNGIPASKKRIKYMQDELNETNYTQEQLDIILARKDRKDIDAIWKQIWDVRRGSLRPLSEEELRQITPLKPEEEKQATSQEYTVFYKNTFDAYAWTLENLMQNTRSLNTQNQYVQIFLDFILEKSRIHQNDFQNKLLQTKDTRPIWEDIWFKNVQKNTPELIKKLNVVTKSGVNVPPKMTGRETALIEIENIIRRHVIKHETDRGIYEVNIPYRERIGQLASIERETNYDEFTKQLLLFADEVLEANNHAKLNEAEKERFIAKFPEPKNDSNTQKDDAPNPKQSKKQRKAEEKKRSGVGDLHFYVWWLFEKKDDYTTVENKHAYPRASSVARFTAKPNIPSEIDSALQGQNSTVGVNGVFLARGLIRRKAPIKDKVPLPDIDETILQNIMNKTGGEGPVIALGVARMQQSNLDVNKLEWRWTPYLGRVKTGEETAGESTDAPATEPASPAPSTEHPSAANPDAGVIDYGEMDDTELLVKKVKDDILKISREFTKLDNHSLHHEGSSKAKLKEQLLDFEVENQKLREKIARLEKNSSNSSKPPSSDIVKP